MLPSDIASDLTGLSHAEARDRLRRYGPNELQTTPPSGPARLLVEIVREPMILLLLACGGIYLAVGSPGEAMILLASVFLVVGISLVQRRRTEKALARLRELSSPRALVRRDGQDVRIAGSEVVPGDLVHLIEGDRVAADGEIVWALNLQIDESLLTGESEPIRKEAGGAPSVTAQAGTLVVGGQGMMRVTAIGGETQFGRIGSALATTPLPQTKLERDTAALVRLLFIVALLSCTGLGFLVAAREGEWLDGALAGLALAMSMIPEELPVILTIFLALGAWRISQRRVLTRRLPAIEALGAATVLCVDKTGTLTENRMALASLVAGGSRIDLAPQEGRTPAELPAELQAVLEYAVLASQQSPFDPMELAIKEAGRRWLGGSEWLHLRWTLVREYPLSRELLAMTHVWEAPQSSQYAIAAKGAPEAIADLCRLDSPTRRSIEAEVARLADDGLRVLGVARAVLARGDLPPDQHGFAFELAGLVAFADPVRAGARASLAECERAGIRTIMMTGDYPRTARAVAVRVGFVRADVVATGAELAGMDDGALARRCAEVDIFARVVPEQKLRLVRALQKRGEVVAMTGDGVNDAPALRAADIGIAMGGRGTDVAREAAALVLLDDDFSSIVAAVRLGRRILDNIRKAMAYVLAMHVPIAGLSFLPALLGWPLILLPLHIVLLEMIIDPASSIAFEAEPEEDDVMARAPRDPQSWLLSFAVVVRSLTQGAILLCASLGTGALYLAQGYAPDQVRTVSFATLVVGNAGLILAERSVRLGTLGSLAIPNAALLAVTAGSIAMIAGLIAWPPARALLKLEPLAGIDIGLVAGAALFAVIGFDMVKRISARLHRRGEPRSTPTANAPQN